MNKFKQKFDNMAGNVKSYGTIAKEGVKVAGLKMQIGQRKRANNANRRMAAGQRLQAKDSASLAASVNKNKRKW